jgi:hypothetical protein
MKPHGFPGSGSIAKLMAYEPDIQVDMVDLMVLMDMKKTMDLVDIEREK